MSTNTRRLPRSAARAGPLAGLRVLVVEDEWLIASELERILGERGCVVVGPAARVAEALQMVAGESFDAALLDANLAGEIATPVAAALAARGTPFAVVTGYDRDQLPEGPLREVPRVRKPFTPDLIAEALSGLVTAKPG